MTTDYRIKDVAARSGFSTATLRYYEEIGLLPTSSRTASGYRVYDDHTLDRLAFIARAKQLGCSLEEISDLATAWDGGACGPVQDRLRVAVADNLAGAQQQIVELMTLTAELQRAATALEAHRPEGACDDSCGCISDPGVGEVAEPLQPIMLGAKPVGGADVPIACTLAADSLPGRLGDWQRLFTHIARRESIEGGVRAVFASTVPVDELMRLVAAEHDCCQFFTFAITVDTRGIALEVSAPDDAMPVVVSLFGAAPSAAAS